MTRFLPLRLGLASLAFGGSLASAQPPGASANAHLDAESKVSGDAKRVLGWIAQSGDNLELPFVIVDKARAQVLAFDRDGVFKGSSAALMGLGQGDKSPAGTGERKLADIPPADRITPAGRFLAALGNDLGEADILWVDYENAISLHRVVAGNPKDRRAERLSSLSAADNRISYGCINVPAKFFDKVIAPLFHRTNGVVYVLPEATPLSEIFDLRDPDRSLASK